MKKVLLGTSAIALAGAFATQASANEWEVRVGGYMEQFVAYSETDDELYDAVTGNCCGDFSGVDNKEDSEIHFSPSITLDNGLQFSARIELEGRTSTAGSSVAGTGDQIDETYMNISGSFGTLRLGEDDMVAYNMAYTAPDVTFLNINSGSDTKYWGGALLTQYTTTLPQVATDPQGISYYSPRFAGFQVGAGYARDGNRATVQGQVDQDATLALTDVWAVGANYVNSFGDFNVALSGGYTAGDGGLDGVAPAFDADFEAWSAGLNLGYAGFTIGGSYKEFDADNSVFDDVVLFHGATEAFSNTTWDAGVAYETGPWGFSFTYLRFEDDVSGAEFDIDKYMVGMSYALAQGVALNAFGVYADAEQEDFFAPGDFDADGWIAGTGVKINF